MNLVIDEYKSGFWLCYPDGEKVFGPYKRNQDAKRELTLMRKK